MVTPEHTRRAREILGPDALLCTEQKVLLESDPGRARQLARRNPALAFGLQLENYQRNLMRLGFESQDFEAECSDRLIDAVVAWGDVKAIEQRVRAHYDAGATHVCLHPLDPQEGRQPDWRLLEALAPASA
jgi:probable F420-dependent oxidoreductase